jgi:ATP/maltotriose-dependent transcriptional regulator MalT
MEDVLRDAREVGERELEARALTALAEVTLLRDADVSRAETLAEKALSVGEQDESRIDALRMLETVAWWRGRLSESEAYAEEALTIARRLGRQDLESEALLSLAGIYTTRRQDDRAEPLIERGQALAEASGSLTAKANAFMKSAELHAWRNRDDDALAEYARARDLYAEVGAATHLAKTMLRTAVIMRKRDLAEAEKLSREAIRILKPVEDRGTLCEVQRLLAELLLEQDRIDEAEVYALKAVETVGPQDVSSQASTKKSLGLVRARQGRDEEAEALFRASVEILERSEYSRFLSDPLKTLIRFLEERGRADEAAPFRTRLAELKGAVPELEEESAVQIA